MIKTGIFDQQHLGVLKKAVEVYARRHQVTAQNISNVETPGYRAQRVKFEEMLADTVADLDPDARAGLGRAVERNSDWVGFALGESVVCHGDVHPGNVMMVDDGVALLDWDLMCLAPPGWDHAPLLRWHERWGGGAYYEPFAEGYGWSARGDRFTESVAELRLVAATLMRIRDAPTAPEARAEAELRLRYWRGDPDAPPWTAR